MFIPTDHAALLHLTRAALSIGIAQAANYAPAQAGRRLCSSLPCFTA